MSILIPSTEPGVLQDAETLKTYNPDIEAYQECDSVLVHEGEVWREVWPEYRQEIHYLMLYDRGNECTDVTGGWNYEQGYVSTYGHPEYVHDGTWSTAKGIELSGYKTAVVNRYNRWMGGTDGKNYTYYNCGGSAGDNRNKVSQKGIVSFDIQEVETAIASVAVASNTYYQTVNRGERKSDSLYIYHKYASYQETELYLYNFFVVKEDDWQTWLTKAGLNPASYGTLDSVMQDAAALSVLLASRPAVSYMIYQCTGSVMASAIQSGVFLSALDSSPYKDEIYANEHWNKFLTMATN